MDVVNYRNCIIDHDGWLINYLFDDETPFGRSKNCPCNLGSSNEKKRLPIESMAYYVDRYSA